MRLKRTSFRWVWFFAIYQNALFSQTFLGIEWTWFQFCTCLMFIFVRVLCKLKAKFKSYIICVNPGLKLCFVMCEMRATHKRFKNALFNNQLRRRHRWVPTLDRGWKIIGIGERMETSTYLVHEKHEQGEILISDNVLPIAKNSVFRVSKQIDSSYQPWLTSPSSPKRAFPANTVFSPMCTNNLIQFGSQRILWTNNIQTNMW